MYKPYSQPKLEWIGKEVKTNNIEMVGTITGMFKDKENEWCLSLDGLSDASLKTLFKYVVWEDGTPFGEKITC